MNVVRSVTAMREYASSMKKSGKSIGFVPTMGYLHEGHLSLMRKAKEDNDIVVISVFRNMPDCFKHIRDEQKKIGENYYEYPEDFEGDVEKATRAGVDVMFMPLVAEMYPEGYCTFVEVERITKHLFGALVPDYFKPVTTGAVKLFNIVKADACYVGQKDYQQAIVVKRMVRDLNMNIEIIVLPTYREKDGLAMSSRNARLNEEERRRSSLIYKTLREAEEAIRGGERDAQRVLGRLISQLKNHDGYEIYSAKICDAETLEDIRTVKGTVLLDVVVKTGTTKLADNIIIEA